VAQHSTVLIGEQPAPDDAPRVYHRAVQTELSEHAQPVWLHRQAGPQCVPFGVSLHELDPEALLMQSSRERKAANPTTHDQHVLGIVHA
jgi:hypothetical protein